MIDIPTLIACGVAPTQARAFAEPLAAACAAWDVTTPKRQAAFLAQGMWESTKFTDLEENLYYTTAARVRKVFGARAGSDLTSLLRDPKALANKVYGGRFGNRPGTNDGWDYRGRGIFGITFRDNYHAAAAACGRPYESIPDLIALPRDACTAAGFYWSSHHCNALADSGDFDGITAKINPAMAGSIGRGTYYAACRAALNV